MCLDSFDEILRMNGTNQRNFRVRRRKIHAFSEIEHVLVRSNEVCCYVVENEFPFWSDIGLVTTGWDGQILRIFFGAHVSGV